MLFSNREKTNQKGRKETEGDYEYLNTSAREESQKIRDFLSSWVKKYPKGERNELIKRLQDDGVHYKSASFELILFAILSRLGCTLSPHPILPNGNDSRPDFLVTAPNFDKFYLEAVLTSEASFDAAAEKRKEFFLSSLQKVNSPNFYLTVEIEGALKSCPSSKPLKKELTNWLKTLDPDAQFTNDDHGIDYPSYQYEIDGMLLKIEAVPIKPEKRGRTTHALGGRMEGGFFNNWTPISKAVRTKGGKYGKLDHPLLIAVDSDAAYLDRIDEVQALFGQEELLFSPLGVGMDPFFRRKPNGAWFGKNGPEYTRVSGVWLFRNLTPWKIASATNTLYFNPWAREKLPPILTKFNHCTGKDGKLTHEEGIPLFKLLGIHETWPLPP
jgi:hypothetical protein